VGSASRDAKEISQMHVDCAQGLNAEARIARFERSTLSTDGLRRHKEIGATHVYTIKSWTKDGIYSESVELRQ